MENNKFQESISVKKEIDEQNKKEKLALNLINADVDVNDLTDEEVDEMIEWFKQDIEKQNNELKRIKDHILQIRKEVLNNAKPIYNYWSSRNRKKYYF